MPIDHRETAAERARLVALLGHIRPELATHEARELGRVRRWGW